MSRLSLTTRLALLFALLSVVVLGTVGAALYRALEQQLTLRDDAALLSRVDQIRTLLQDANTMDLIRDKPQLFANMLGNPEAMLVVRPKGQAPLIEVNPAVLPVPERAPLAAGATLALTDVRHGVDALGIPISTVAATLQRGAGEPELEIIAGRLMKERSRTLFIYRERIILLVAGGVVLATLAAVFLVAIGLRPLRHLARKTDAVSISNLHSHIAKDDAPTELAPLIDAFNAMLDRLSSGFARMSQLSADMAHDLRTPIANLLGQTEVALGQRRSADYYEALLESNFEEFQRLSRMMDNMLFLARAEQPDATIEHAVLDIGAEFERVADYFEGLADERSLRFLLQGSGTVWADPILLRRALANLIANAIQYADSASSIVLGSATTRAGTALTVTNTGPAIGQDQLPRLFDRFYRADASRRGSATASGLGLSIVRSIMGLHYGTASASSDATSVQFTLCFPERVSIQT